jgi:PAS domain S-box-containing protein
MQHPAKLSFDSSTGDGEQWYRAIVATMQEGLVVIDGHGVVAWANPRAEQMLGSGRIVGTTLYDPIWNAVQDDGSALMKQNHPGAIALRSGRPLSGVAMGMRRADATMIWLSVNADPIFADNDVAPRGALLTFRDVTRERAADQVRTEFVSQVSHELRTPLTSIKGYVDLLLDDARLTDEQRDFLAVVKRNTERGEGLISELLDISQIDTGRLKLVRNALNVRVLIDEIISSMRPLIDQHELEVFQHFPATLEPVWADARRVGQIVSNLLSNAIKYTPRGGKIHITGFDDRGYVIIEVQDNGIGISAEEQKRLFQRFFRASNRMTREVAGTGLGLALTRSLVELHGGQITCESAPGIGTTFRFTLPVPPPLQRRLRRTDW